MIKHFLIIFKASAMIKQGIKHCHLFVWLLLLLPHFSQPLSSNQCNSCYDKCWKCSDVIEVPNGLEEDLEILYLSDSILGLIPGKAFSRYRKIKELHLNNCSLKTVQGDAFSGLNDLEFVDLSHNKISDSLSKTVFQSNINLGEVNLEHNNIVRIKPYFLSSVSIRKLHLTGNSITEVSPESFKHLPKLEELYLEKNKLKVLPPNLFPSQKNILKLYIDQNTVAVDSCNPRLRIFVGGELLQCDRAESDGAIYAAGRKTEITTTTDQEFEMSNTEFLENNKSDDSNISEEVKYSQTRTFGVTKLTSQTSTNRKVYSRKLKVSTLINSEEPFYSTKPTALSPISIKEPTETLLNSLSENVERKMIFLILMTAIILFATLILYMIVKHCSCYFCPSPQRMQQQPQAVIIDPSLHYSHLIHSTGPASRYSYHPSLHYSHLIHSTGPASRNSYQVYQPLSTTSQCSDHTYQEIQ